MSLAILISLLSHPMKLSRMITAFLSLWILASPCLAKAPNILFISVDDLNDWAGYRGDKQVISPHMDKLASEGVWFSRAYCQYPLCGPSRASVMSGLYFHQLNSAKLQMKDSDVAKTTEAMGSRLLHSYFKDHGYKTLAVGKILHRHLPKADLDESGGRGPWDYHVDEDGKRAKTYWKSTQTLTDWGISQIPENEMSDTKAAAWAVDRLGEKHDKPFMLMVGFLRPHVPWYVPEKYFKMYDRSKVMLPTYKKDDLDDVPEAGKATINDGYPRTEWAIKNQQWQHIVQSYLASITFVDSKVGQILNALKAGPHRDNTIVVLWSDHGYHLGEKNTFQKHTLWERSAKVPLIVKLPPSLQVQMIKGQCDRVVGLIDLYPTLVDLCGLPANEKAVGRSLKPLLKDHETKWDYPALTYLKDGGKSIRTSRYRYIEYGDGSAELYNHRNDTNELTNLVDNPEYTKALQMMKSKLSRTHLKD